MIFRHFWQKGTFSVSQKYFPAALLAKGYIIVDRSEHQVVLQRRTSFNGLIFFLGFLFLVAGAFLYVVYYLLKRLGDELVTVELIQP